MGRTGSNITGSVLVVGLGAWQPGGDRGDVDEPAAVPDAAIDAGVTFVGTADAYGDLAAGS